MFDPQKKKQDFHENFNTGIPILRKGKMFKKEKEINDANFSSEFSDKIVTKLCCRQSRKIQYGK